jgi:hypothetical protein
MQRHRAQFDIACGYGPRKTSKTYTEAYSYAYEQQEKLSSNQVEF